MFHGSVPESSYSITRRRFIVAHTYCITLANFYINHNSKSQSKGYHVTLYPMHQKGYHVKLYSMHPIFQNWGTPWPYKD